MQKETMDNYQDETTFEVTVAGDGVSTSGISSPQIVLDTSNTNTLSWGINECSSSFQSVSSCETLESYEPVRAESPKVIVVPFLAENQVTGTMIANNGVHIPLIKECSIRIDPLKMAAVPSDDRMDERIIELPFSTDTTSDSSTNIPSCIPNDEDSSPFLGFEMESLNGTLCELYKKAVRLIQENAARVANDQSRYANEPIVIDRDSSEPILTERILTERHFIDRQSTGRSTKSETVKRPRQIQRKVAKPQAPDDQLVTQNQVRSVPTTVNTEVNLSQSPRKQNNVVKPDVPTPERVSFLPVQIADVKPNRVSDSSDSDSDVIISTPVTPVVLADSSANKRSLERSEDNRKKSSERELRRLEKMRRRKELNWIAEKIHDQWKERIEAIKRKQRKKEARKRKSESSRSHSSKHEGSQRHHKRKRVSYSSDTDSTDTSSSSRTSCSSSSSDSDSNDSDPDTYTSDTSYTSQTSQSHTRTESDSTDTDSSDHRYRRRLNKYRRPPSETSDTSETSSSEEDEDSEPGRYVKRRKFQSMKRTHRKPSTSEGNCIVSRRRKSLESFRSEESLQQKQRNMKRRSSDVEEDQPKRMKSPLIMKRKQQKFNAPSTSAAATVRKFPRFTDRSVVESTSAGDFLIK